MDHGVVYVVSFQHHYRQRRTRIGGPGQLYTIRILVVQVGERTPTQAR